MCECVYMLGLCSGSGCVCKKRVCGLFAFNVLYYLLHFLVLLVFLFLFFLFLVLELKLIKVQEFKCSDKCQWTLYVHGKVTFTRWRYFLLKKNDEIWLWRLTWFGYMLKSKRNVNLMSIQKHKEEVEEFCYNLSNIIFFIWSRYIGWQSDLPFDSITS